MIKHDFYVHFKFIDLLECTFTLGVSSVCTHCFVYTYLSLRVCMFYFETGSEYILHGVVSLRPSHTSPVSLRPSHTSPVSLRPSHFARLTSPESHFVRVTLRPSHTSPVSHFARLTSPDTLRPLYFSHIIVTNIKNTCVCACLSACDLCVREFLDRKCV